MASWLPLNELKPKCSCRLALRSMLFFAALDLLVPLLFLFGDTVLADGFFVAVGMSVCFPSHSNASLLCVLKK